MISATEIVQRPELLGRMQEKLREYRSEGAGAGFECFGRFRSDCGECVSCELSPACAAVLGSPLCGLEHRGGRVRIVVVTIRGKSLGEYL